MNLHRLIEQYISFQQSLGSSFITDASVLRAFGRTRSPRASVASVCVRHVEAFLGNARPVTKTWFNKLSCLRCFFRYAVSRDHISAAPLPTVIPKHPPEFVPYIYTREELRRLLQMVESHPRSTTLEPATLRTMILVYYGAGLRRREAINLTRADADLNKSILAIRNTKFGKSRLVPIGPQLNRALVQYDRTRPKRRPVDELRPLIDRRAGSEHVFLNRRGQPLTRFGIHALVERHAAYLPTQLPSLANKRVSPHTIRHTTATHLLRAGVDINTIRAWLGHVSLTTTNVYAEVDLEMKAKALVKCEIKSGKPRKPWRKNPGLMDFLRTL